MHSGAMGRIAAFCSYAHEDARLLAELKSALAPLRERAVIDDWSDGRIEPGTDWDAQILHSLDRARLVLFLVTPALLASRFVSEREIPHAMARREQERCEIVPILGLRPAEESTWHASALAKLQPLPQVGVWIDDHRDTASAWDAIRLGITQVCQRIGGSDNPYRRCQVGDWRHVQRRMDLGGQSAKWEYTECVIDRNENTAVLQVESTMTGAVQHHRIELDLTQPLGTQGSSVARQLGVNLDAAAGMATTTPADGVEVTEEIVMVGFTSYETTLRTAVAHSELDGLTMDTRFRVWSSIDVPFDGVVRARNEFSWSNGARGLQSMELLAFGLGDAAACKPTPASHGGVPPQLAQAMGLSNAAPFGGTPQPGPGPWAGAPGVSGPFGQIIPTPAPLIMPGRWGLQTQDAFGQVSFDLMLYPNLQLQGYCWNGGPGPWQLAGSWAFDAAAGVLSFQAVASAPGMPSCPSGAWFRIIEAGPAGYAVLDMNGRSFRLWRIG